MEHAFNPNTQEAEVGTALGVWGQPGLYSEFQDNQSYVERPCLIKIKKKNKKRRHKGRRKGSQIGG